MTQDLLTWGALIASTGSVATCVGMIWRGAVASAMTRGKATAAEATATTALGQVALIREQLTDARLEIAREYATHKDLAASEMRIGEALAGLRQEVRGLNDRLDRVIAKHVRNE
jgi:hypothetical protein